jgi:hypothetical protein
VQRRTRNVVIRDIRRKFRALRGVLNERQRRLWAATEAKALGRGGPSWVSKATGISRRTIYAGLNELDGPASGLGEQRSRAPGAGRKRLTVLHPELPDVLDALIEPTTRGDPESPLRWTTTSSRAIAEELTAQGFPISPQAVRNMLRDNDFSLQANRKTQEGNQHPDRDAQFRYINNRAKELQRRDQPVVSVDTKKKENIGQFKNKGRGWRPKGKPCEVKVHDFIDKELGKVAPYGIYDIGANVGWVSVGISHDTAEFAVNSIKAWWSKMGKKRYPMATELMITADSGGSNSSRTRLWKVSLQKLADQTGLRIRVCHYPPGTSKWNKIEHRMFSFITKNWQGKPLVTQQAVVDLIGNTRTRTGLVIKAALDRRTYRKGVKVSDEEMAALNIKRARFHGDWNYTVLPRN